MSFIEVDYIRTNLQSIAGVDEVGRGPLAGSVVAGCALYNIGSFLNNDFQFLKDLGVSDSKKLTDKKRITILNELGLKLTKQKQTLFDGRLSICLSEVGHQRIDQINILQASLLAMKRSFENLHDKHNQAVVLIDGNKSFKTSSQVHAHTLVKGDEKSVLIGLSSILAKVYRDELMKKLSKSYPHYGFENNAGYPTKLHRHAIEQYGITPYHRKSFKGVKEYVQSH